MKKLNKDADDFNQATNSRQETSDTLLTEQEINIYKKKIALSSLFILCLLGVHIYLYVFNNFRIWSSIVAFLLFVLMSLIIHIWHKAVKQGFRQRKETENILEGIKQSIYLSALLLIFNYAFSGI